MFALTYHDEAVVVMYLSCCCISHIHPGMAHVTLDRSQSDTDEGPTFALISQPEWQALNGE